MPAHSGTHHHFWCQLGETSWCWCWWAWSRLTSISLRSDKDEEDINGCKAISCRKCKTVALQTWLWAPTCKKPVREQLQSWALLSAKPSPRPLYPTFSVPWESMGVIGQNCPITLLDSTRQLVTIFPECFEGSAQWSNRPIHSLPRTHTEIHHNPCWPCLAYKAVAMMVNALNALLLFLPYQAD